MSKSSNRASLMGLKYKLPAIPQAEPVVVAPEAESHILQTDRADYPSTPESDPGPAAAAVAPRENRIAGKEPTVLMNAKLPIHLHARLKRTAQFNDISMTEIIIRAVEAELGTGRYAEPPEAWGSQNVYR